MSRSVESVATPTSRRLRLARTGARFREVSVAVTTALFVLAQTTFLWAFGALPAQHAAEIWIVTGVLAALSAQAWLMRRHLPAHTDMLLLMMAWGGFGMLWGWQLDGAMAASGGHAMKGIYTGWFRWLNGMNGLMLLFAFPPSLAWARCLIPYRPYFWRMVWVLALDAVGMVFGMMAGGRLLGHPLGMILQTPTLAHHLAMLLGMLGGMALTMLARPWLAPLPRPR